MELSLKANPREKIGGNLNALRENGVLPGVIYGYKIKNAKPIQLNYKDFLRVYGEAGENTLINLDLDGEKYNVLVYDAKMHPTSGQFLHADFYRVRMDQKIEADVPLEFVGESEAVKALGGVLVKSLHEVTVKAFPKDLPHQINVDISLLKTFDNIIKVKDLPLSQGVEVMMGAEDAIASVAEPRSEEELAELEAAPEQADVETVKVETEEKKEEREVAAANEKSSE